MTPERLQKILARAGYGSRRSCEQLILSDRVRVNKKTVTLGDKAEAGIDEITVDGRKVDFPETFTYIALYKPRNVISAVTTPEQRRTVRDLVGVEGTLYPLLTRQKNAGLLSYRWEESTQGPPRKYYTITELGREFLKELHFSWQELVTAVESINKSKEA